MNKKCVNIEVAENCGFCFGVRRAVELVYDLRHKTQKTIYIIGELIHNSIFIKRLEQDGIFCIDEQDVALHIPEKDSCVMVIRTHGVTKDLSQKLNELGFTVVDATCPFVKRIHKIMDENSKDCDLAMIIGDKNHPEVIGIQSYAHSTSVICADDNECETFMNNNKGKSVEKILLVSQTTGNNDKYVNCQKVIKKGYTNAKIFDTICSVTENRQNEVKDMASRADMMCVIGCTKSSNTKKLFEIALQFCEHVYLLETADDLQEDVLKKHVSAWEKKKTNTSFTVGITAGASTPDDIIEEVKVRVESILYSDEKQNDGHIND